ncbi:hypothetical protein AB0A63_39295 [Lentzea sp. NPDC042327]|uniref:hypothetical protein n=1 Tax=Lentzea sp. NPDC042327 TaxID=3154801 RepID=UPI0033D2D8CE
MDEKPFQFLGEVRDPLPARPGRDARQDSEYVRCGTCSIFVWAEPLRGWRRVHALAQRTKLDWAGQVKHLLTVDYPDAETVVLVMDNLQHPRHRLALRSLRPRRGLRPGSATRDPPHTQTRVLAAPATGSQAPSRPTPVPTPPAAPAPPIPPAPAPPATRPLLPPRPPRPPLPPLPAVSTTVSLPAPPVTVPALPVKPSHRGAQVDQGPARRTGTCCRSLDRPFTLK